MSNLNIAFLASKAPDAQIALERLTSMYGNTDVLSADVIVALGGDGFLIEALHDTEFLDTPVYGMNLGTVGFMLNPYKDDDLVERLTNAREEIIHPLQVTARDTDDKLIMASAINEVSILRQGPQAANIRITVDEVLRMDPLMADGALLATPAGSTAYNYSANGPILPLGSNVLALTAIAPFRPRRWRGAVLPNTATVRFENTDTAKRPLMMSADSQSFPNISVVEVTVDQKFKHRLLFDPSRGLQDRILDEQFV
jgi:NAD+ kinase